MQYASFRVIGTKYYYYLGQPVSVQCTSGPIFGGVTTLNVAKTTGLTAGSIDMNSSVGTVFATPAEFNAVIASLPGVSNTNPVWLVIGYNASGNIASVITIAPSSRPALALEKLQAKVADLSASSREISQLIEGEVLAELRKLTGLLQTGVSLLRERSVGDVSIPYERPSDLPSEPPSGPGEEINPDGGLDQLTQLTIADIKKSEANGYDKKPVGH